MSSPAPAPLIPSSTPSKTPLFSPRLTLCFDNHPQHRLFRSKLPLCFHNDTKHTPRNPRVFITIRKYPGYPSGDTNPAPCSYCAVGNLLSISRSSLPAFNIALILLPGDSKRSTRATAWQTFTRLKSLLARNRTVLEGRAYPPERYPGRLWQAANRGGLPQPLRQRTAMPEAVAGMLGLTVPMKVSEPLPTSVRQPVIESVRPTTNE